MLTGLFPSTDGIAYVGGYDVSDDIDNVHMVMGLCPQFDCLWDDLTCLEHMLFYSRLKARQRHLAQAASLRITRECYSSRNLPISQSHPVEKTNTAASSFAMWVYTKRDIANLRT